MSISRAAVGAAILSFGLVAGGLGSTAQDAKKGASASPAAAAGQNWTGTVQADQATAGRTLDDAQIAAIKKVSGYFNELTNLRGTFTQTDPDAKRVRGRMYVKRPGRFRFDYGAPSKKVIISDGQYLAIQDHDLNNEDIFELDNTPFRLLLRKDVDLMRDARISEVQESEDLVIVSMQDKSPDAPGRITLFLAKKPSLELKEWITTDAQGLNTRVEVSDLVKSEDLDANLFKRENLSIKKLQ